jgi:hypothetical protein
LRKEGQVEGNKIAAEASNWNAGNLATSVPFDQSNRVASLPSWTDLARLAGWITITDPLFGQGMRFA